MADERSGRDARCGHRDLVVGNAEQDDVDILRRRAAPERAGNGVAGGSQRRRQGEAKSARADDGYVSSY
jgi:hypothetical protein